MSHRHTDDGIVAELLPAFIEEANEQVAEFEQLMLRLEDAPDDHELLDALFRCAHTIKGSAGVFGVDAVVAFTHHVETLLARLREGRVVLTPTLSTLLLQGNDVIQALVANALGEHAETPESAAARLSIVERLRAATAESDAATDAPTSTPTLAGADESAATSGARRWQVSIQFGLDTFRHGMDPLTIVNYVARLGHIAMLRCDSAAVPSLEDFDPENCHLAFAFALDTEATREEIEQAFAFVSEGSVIEIVAPAAMALADIATAIASADACVASEPESQADAVDAVRDVAGKPKPKATREGGAPAEESSFIRVHAHRLDEVINLLGELVIAGAGASMLARQTRQRGLIEANQRITRLIEGIRNSTLKLRMVPIGETFARFRRVVRDTAAELGKEVQLEIVGGDTELDKAVVERIADPLMHLVRNALDHGLERPEQRTEAGKPTLGKLTLSARHESGSILIRIEDDGRGIQRDKVLQRARERGLLDAHEVPADADILKLIFEPGFSTAEKVTNLSGRGVGMDVVRRNIEALRGSVMLSSETGLGSCIEIRLPLTLAIIDGFLIGVGNSRFILPLDSVVEVIASRPSAARPDDHGRSVVELRGQVLPVVDLRTMYALESPAPERSSVVVVRAGSRRFGVRVDTLLGQHQTVIKPLGPLLRSLRGVSGSSILGSGDVALIFDVPSLGQLAAGPRQAAAPKPTRPDAEAGATAPLTPVGEPT